MDYLTADLCDEHPDDVHVAESLFTHYGGRRRFHGRTVTLKVHEDNLLVRETLEDDGAGRVLVVDGGGSLRRALVGGNLVVLAKDKGWAGIVVNGCVRDCTEICKVGLGVLALATSPMKSRKSGDGQAGVSVSFGGITIRPGEHLYADEDGMVVSARPLHEDD